MSPIQAIKIQPRLPVTALLASYRFYQDVLGFACPNGGPSESESFAILQRDSAGLQLVTASADHPAGRMTIWIQVADALAEFERVKRRARVVKGSDLIVHKAGLRN